MEYSAIQPGGLREISRWSAQRHHRISSSRNRIPEGCQNASNDTPMFTILSLHDPLIFITDASIPVLDRAGVECDVTQHHKRAAPQKGTLYFTDKVECPLYTPLTLCNKSNTEH